MQGTFRLAKTGDEWRLLEPLDDLADREHLRNVISNLNALRIETFLDDDNDLARLGRDEPARRVTLVRSGGKDPVVLELGATREVDGATQVACRRGDGAQFWIDDRAEISLGKAPVLWRSKTVHPFDSWDVEAVTFTGALRTGAVIAGGDQALVETLARYGECVGRAFQIRDDMLDFSASAATRLQVRELSRIGWSETTSRAPEPG